MLDAGRNERRFCAHCGARLGRSGSPGSDEGRAQPGPDRRVVTVLFADVSGYTSLSAGQDPERVAEILNAYFKVLTEPIYRCGGVVDKFMGDAIMALFGAPRAHEDDPERAVLAALEMQRAAQAYAAQLARESGLSLALRIGVNTGLVVAGTVGGGPKADYTVMGEAVNLAQRLETAATPGTVLVGEATFAHTRERFEYEPLAPIPLKGLPEPVRAYRLVAARAPARTELRDRTPLIGRHGELARLAVCLDYLEAGHPQVLALIGDAGAGKSRLAREFVQQVRRRQIGRLVRVRCPSYGREHAFRMVHSLVEAWLDIPRGAGTSRIPAALADRGRRCGTSEPRETAELIASLLGHEASDGLPPEQRRNAAFRALNDLLVADARRVPLVLVVDDLHWADDGSLGWLDSFVDRIAAEADPLPVLVLVQLRPTRPALADWAGKVDLTRIVLRPLTADDQEALLAATLGLPDDHAAWPPALRSLAQAVARRAEGNPLFLLELVKRLVDARALIRAPAGWEMASPRGQIDLPTSIRGVVAARLDSLAEPLRRAVQVASVIGRSFYPELLAAVLGEQAGAMADELIARDVFHRRQSGEIAFNQGVFQEVAYDSLLLSVRRELHRRVAEALETSPGPSAGPHELAYHYSRAQEASKAALFLYRAGTFALRSFASEDARRAFREALAFLERGACPLEVSRRAVLSALAEVSLTLGHYGEARDCAQEALAEAWSEEALGPAADLYLLLARILDAQGALQDGLSLLEEAESRLAPLAAGAVPRLLLARSWLALRQGSYSEGTALAGQALELLEPGSPERAQAHNNLGGCYYRMNEWENALAHYDEALRLRTGSQDILGIADALHNLGLVHYQLGDWPAAAEHYARALKLYERLGDVARLLTVQLNLGTLRLDMGRRDEAIDHFTRAHDLSARTGNTFMVEVTRVGLGNALAHAGRVEEAVRLLQEGLAGMERSGAFEHQPEAHQILGRVFLESDRNQEARTHLDAALELARRAGDRLQEAIVMRHLARLEAQEGDAAKALAMLEAAHGLLHELGVRLELGRTLLAKAHLLAENGAAAQAAPLALRAESLFRKLGATADLGRAERLLEIVRG